MASISREWKCQQGLTMSQIDVHQTRKFTFQSVHWEYSGATSRTDSWQRWKCQPTVNVSFVNSIHFFSPFDINPPCSAHSQFFALVFWVYLSTVWARHGYRGHRNLESICWEPRTVEEPHSNSEFRQNLCTSWISIFLMSAYSVHSTSLIFLPPIPLRTLSAVCHAPANRPVTSDLVNWPLVTSNQTAPPSQKNGASSST